MPAHQQKGSVPEYTASGRLVPAHLKDQIIRFKEILPQYKSSTNDEIICLFEEFNNDFQSAVYGATHGLTQNKASDNWESVGKKKKKKAPTNTNRGNNFSNSRTPNRNDNRSSNSDNSGNNSFRGQGSNRGGYVKQDNTRHRTTPASVPSSIPAPTAPTEVSTWGSEPWETNAPAASSTTVVAETQKKATVPVATPAVSTSSPAPTKPKVSGPTTPAWGENSISSAARAKQNTQTSTPVQKPFSGTKQTSEDFGGDSYANIAKTRQVWNPTTAAAPVSAPVAAVAPARLAPSQPEPVKAPVETPAPKAAPAPVVSLLAQTPVHEVQPKPAKVVERPRAGVLLPGNFSGEGLSYQFGNLGLSFNEESLIAGNTLAAEELKPVEAPAPRAPVSIPAQKEASALVEESIVDHVPGAQFFPYQPMYSAMEMSDPSGQRLPMMSPYYPAEPQAFARNDGQKYPRGSNPNYPSSGRDTTKFSSDSVANQTAQQQQQQQQQQVPYYPHYVYPAFPNQFAAGSYGNQPFFPPFRHSYGFQSYGANGIPSHYVPDEDYKHRGAPSPYYGPQEGTLGGPNGKPQGAQGHNQVKPGSMEGFSAADPSVAFGKPNDYYAPGDMYMNNSFANQQFGYPMMGQPPAHYQPQPPLPQQSQPSQQQGNRNY